MQPIYIPNAILLRLQTYLQDLFPILDSELGPDIQHLLTALQAAAKLASLESDCSTFSFGQSGPLVVPWRSSSSTAVNSRASSPRAPSLCLDASANQANSLPPSSPPAFLDSEDELEPIEELDELQDQSEEESRALQADSSGLNPRALRAARRNQGQIEPQVEAGNPVGVELRVRRKKKKKPCPRAGTKAPVAVAAMARDMYQGLPMVPHPDGPEPDPSVSEDNHYAPGVGEGSGSGEIGISGEHSKRWKVTARRAKFKLAAAPMLSRLSDIATVSRELELVQFVHSLCSAPSISSSSSSSNPIAQTVESIESLGMEIRVFNFYAMIKTMQLAILVDG